MKIRRISAIAILGMVAIFVLRSNIAIAQSDGEAEYRPPMRGAPASRVGGGTRGSGDERPRLVVIAPDHTGQTLREQPELYWYVSKPSAARLEISIINDQAVQPVVEKTVQAPTVAGLQRISLADYGVKLDPNIEYRWFVGLVIDDRQRSNDVVASGTILRVVATPAMQERLGKADGKTRYRVLAQEGVWYDAIAEVSAQIRENPENAALKRDFARLLEQVGLRDIVTK